MTSTSLVPVTVDGRSLAIEAAWVGPGQVDPALPILVFLHEGLGSVAMWRDFPARLCAAVGRRGLVYSRPGYGRSTPRRPDERWRPDYLHVQARQVLPALLEAVDVRRPVVLFGHSDGASIALIHAATFPDRVSAAVVMAPHLFVEAFSLDGIRQTVAAYETTGLRERLARYHDDVDSAFFGWSDIWLSPEFAPWSIEDLLSGITCPVLAIQGVDDEYGTMAQVDGIAARVTGTTLMKLASCGHSPQRDQPQAVIEGVRAILQRVRGD
jgi:pimeloyl-ACP methyl ester carboxylesterase